MTIAYIPQHHPHLLSHTDYFHSADYRPRTKPRKDCPLRQTARTKDNSTTTPHKCPTKVPGKLPNKPNRWTQEQEQETFGCRTIFFPDWLLLKTHCRRTTLQVLSCLVPSVWESGVCEVANIHQSCPNYSVLWSTAQGQYPLGGNIEVYAHPTIE